MKSSKYTFGFAYPIVLLVLLHLVLRLLVAQFSNLGVDEVYYTLYAKYPDWSYFDHPPLIGWLIYLTTFGGWLDTDVMVRMSALVLGSVNLLLLYGLGRELHSEKIGWIAAVLGAASFYIGIISGVFVLPDTPLNTAWLLALFCFIRYNATHKNKWILLMGLCIGLGMLSKYIAVFAWLAAGLYWLLKDVKTLLKRDFWLAILLSVLLFAPVICWNLTTEYSGVNYHAERVGGGWWPSLSHFFPNFFGQIFYNNPVNVILIGMAVFWLFRNGKWWNNNHFFALLCWGLPLIITTLIMALYNQTLPHWSGPAYFSLLLLAAIYMVDVKKWSKLNRWLLGSTILYLLVVVLGLLQINTAILPLASNDQPEHLGKTDFTSDLSAWSHARQTTDAVLDPALPIVTAKWFPAAHIERYIARENKVYVYGTRNDLHHYLLIHDRQAPIEKGSDIYYISSSQYYREPPVGLVDQFEKISEPQYIPLQRNGKVRNNLVIWTLFNAKDKVELLENNIP